MYQAILHVFLCGQNGRMGLSRLVCLPFQPVPGMELDCLTTVVDEPKMMVAVRWHPIDGCFHIELDDCEADRPLSELIDHFGPGWQLHEPGLVCPETD